jgi:protein-ribulosamine 3-kinase
MKTGIETDLKEFLKTHAGIEAQDVQFSAVGGGSINDSYRLTINKTIRFFCKINSTQKFPGLFEKEKNGLALLKKQNLIRIPGVIGVFESGTLQVLIMEWIEQGARTEKFWRRFGEQLAALHSVEADFYGLDEDNYMGALPQSNSKRTNWPEFFIHNRLMPQVKMAIDKGLLSPADSAVFEKVYRIIPIVFPSASPVLLHGDLWSGNFLSDAESNPVLIDPACYYGHSSIDLAMTTLFGGFEKGFYEAYARQKPFQPGYQEQWEICNLYPLMVHLNLFGSSYRSSIIRTIQRY